MRKRHVIAATAAAGLVLTAIPGEAAARPQLTDPRGDSLVAGADILSATFESTFKKVRKGKGKHKKVKKVPTGFTLSLKLAAAPANNVWFQVGAARPGCPEFNFDYSTSQLGPGPTGAGCATATSTNYIKGITPTVSGSTIRWKVPISKIGKGTRFTSISAVAYNLVVAPGVVSLGTPPWDDAVAPASASYVVGK